MKYKRPRGTQDIIAPAIETWRRVERVFEDAFDRFGYSGIRTPIIEQTDLFVRAVGEQTDIVSKEMYTFTDRGGRSITLRPENTAAVIRAYLENGMHRLGGVQRLCYSGAMFRYDRPQAGRYRQFHQVGAEAIGTSNPALDVEMIQLVVESMRRLGFEQLDIRLNSVGGKRSRGPYRDVLLDAIRGLSGELEPEALERYTRNPLRIFDSKDCDQALKSRLPLISHHLVGEDAEHYAQVKGLLDALGVPYVGDPHLVRGLDYYTRTVFEVFHGARGSQNALCGGGRYDDLVAECGGPDTPAIGFSAGLERIIDALPSGGVPGGPEPPRIRFYVVCADAAAHTRALRAAAELRAIGNTEVDLAGRSRKKQLQAAEKSPARFAVVVSSDSPSSVTVRDLASRADTSVDDDDLGAYGPLREDLPGAADKEGRS